VNAVGDQSAAAKPRDPAGRADPDWVLAGRATPVTVVVCTRDRAEQLARCLDALRRLEHDDLEILIVDNAPADDATERLVTARAAADPRLRYVREERPGLSRARNRGLREARAGIVAFTDDDVLVDPLWAAALARGFARDPQVACVTGLVATASLGLPEERYFDARVSWASSCEQRVFSAVRTAGDSVLHPFAAGAFGTGANMAFRADVLRALGGFDECLGAGSPAAGGEDLDAFLRVLLEGFRLSFEPASLVWHEHRAAAGDLDRQMFDYGKGLTAYLFKHATSRRSAPGMAGRMVPGLVRFAGLTRGSRRATRGTATARRAPLWEVAGSLTGPLAYWRGRQVAARSTRMS
jgi:GT2 family glycosyltransferase